MKKLMLFFLGAVLLLSTAIPQISQGSRLRGEAVPSTAFYIQSAAAHGRGHRGYWSILNQPRRFDANLEFCLSNLPRQRAGLEYRYTFIRTRVGSNDYYEIRVGNDYNTRVTAVGGRGRNIMKRSGRQFNGQVVTRRAANSDSQTFYLEHVGNGRFKIVNINGQVIGLRSGGVQRGNSLMLQNYNGRAEQKWVLINANTNRVFSPTPPRHQQQNYHQQQQNYHHQQQQQTPPQKEKPKNEKPQKKSLKDMLKK